MIDLSLLVITPEILSLIAEIDEFKGRWQLLGKLTPERLKGLRRIATIESIGSSTRIEGSKLTDQEVELLLSRIDEHSFRSRDEQEVAGYAFVCEEIYSHYSLMNLTENMIKHLHGKLLQYSDKDQYHRAEYKKVANNIEAFDYQGNNIGVIFETASPFETTLKMQELIRWVGETKESKAIHPLLMIAIFAVVFLAIHPFQDGNGRLSRCLTTLLLLQAGYQYVPYSSLESIIEANKESYYLALRRTQQSLKKAADFSPWLLFFLRSLIQQKRTLEAKLEKERKLTLDLPSLSAKILALLEQHGRLTMREIVVLSQANRNTIKKHLHTLKESNLVVQHGQGRATWYTLRS